MIWWLRTCFTGPCRSTVHPVPNVRGQNSSEPPLQSARHRSPPGGARTGLARCPCRNVSGDGQPLLPSVQVVEVADREPWSAWPSPATQRYGRCASAIGTSGQRAIPTARAPRCADQCTQFHHRLVVVAGVLRSIEKVCGQGPELLPSRGCRSGCDAEHPGQHPIDIPIHHRFGQPEGDGANGRSGVVAHALQTLSRPDR
jgi:hypothetical protein